MSDMKCPFCQQELKELHVNGFSVGFRCKNKNCPETSIMCGTKALWQELIHTRKTLEQSETCCTEWEKQALDYKAENIALSGELERTRKALDVAVDALKEYADRDNWGMGFAPWLEDGFKDALYTEDGYKTAEKALEQITALEQKDK